MQKTLGNGSATHLKILPVLTWLIIKTAYCMKSMAYRKNLSFQSLLTKPCSASVDAVTVISLLRYL